MSTVTVMGLSILPGEGKVAGYSLEIPAFILSYFCMCIGSEE